MEEELKRFEEKVHHVVVHQAGDLPPALRVRVLLFTAIVLHEVQDESWSPELFLAECHRALRMHGDACAEVVRRTT